MGLCSDPGLNYLKGIGYNVVRLPKEGIEPLDVIGWSKDSAQVLGKLPDLIVGDAGSLPQSRTVVAANVNGQKSASLKIGVGIKILDGMISALGGGTLGASVNYTNAKKVTFLFENVTSTLVDAIPVGRFLRDGDIDQNDPVSHPYLTGSGRLLVIVDALKSNKISVKLESSDGIGAAIDVPVIANAVGGNVGVDTARKAEGVLTFSGDKMLTFGFKCFQVSIVDGELRLVAVPAGGAFLSVEDEGGEPAILIGEGTGLSGFVDIQ